MENLNFSDMIKKLFILAASAICLCQSYAADEDTAIRWFRQNAERGDASAQYNLALCYYKGEGIVKNEDEALKWFQKAADQGNRDAQFYIGRAYFLGKGFVKNEAEGVKWYLRAAEQGQLESQNNLGLCYQQGIGVTKSDDEAVKWFRKAAERGNEPAQCNLAICYINGTGVEKSETEGVKWFSKAAAQGDNQAEFYVGLCYTKGIGVQKSETEALKWYLKAAEHGNDSARKAIKDLESMKIDKIKSCSQAAENGDVNAQYELALIYTNTDSSEWNPQKALQWFRKAAEQGHLKSQLYLAFCFSQDYDNIDRKAEGLSVEVLSTIGREISSDYEKSCGRGGIAEAAQWMRKAAEQGHKAAQYRLGAYYGINSLKINPEEAAKWYLKAAEQGHRDAQFELAKCYEEGKGVDDDMTEAFKWYRKAAEQGQAEAQNRLAECYLRGEGITQNLEEAKKWNRKAIEQNAASTSYAHIIEAPPITPAKPKVDRNPTDATAQYNLALQYENGEGPVVVNASKSEKWLLKAAEQGHKEAQFKLAILYYDRDAQEAYKWYRKAAEQGHAESAYRLGMTNDNVNGITEARKWYLKAAEQGHVEAQYALGESYAMREFLTKLDLTEALKWYAKAAAQGHKDAQQRIGYIKDYLVSSNTK